MRILLAHNYYRHPGGEDSVFAAEGKLLSNAGHQIQLYTTNNEALHNFTTKLKTAWQVTYSSQSKHSFKRALRSFQPEVVHIHNFFPMMTPSIYDACDECGIPVVQTLHNYRMICPGELLLRHGKICETCIDSSPYWGAVYRCYQNSLLGSLAVARMISYHRKEQTWTRKVTKFIALTDFTRQKFIEGGLPAEKIIVKPNCYAGFTGGEESKTRQRHGALFVGRLSKEKGVSTLLKASEKIKFPLAIIGDGTLEKSVLSARNKYISTKGWLQPHEVSKAMGEAAFLVMPSECYETFGLVVIEAFAHGLPVIASRLGAMAELVQDGVTGLHFTPGDAYDLAEKMQWLHDHPQQASAMGNNARKIYLKKYTPEKNYELLINIYTEARSAKQRDLTAKTVEFCADSNLKPQG